MGTRGKFLTSVILVSTQAILITCLADSEILGGDTTFCFLLPIPGTGRALAGHGNPEMTVVPLSCAASGCQGQSPLQPLAGPPPTCLWFPWRPRSHQVPSPLGKCQVPPVSPRAQGLAQKEDSGPGPSSLEVSYCCC